MSALNATMAARLWARVNKEGPVIRPELGPCWIFTGFTTRKGEGYGQISNWPDPRPVPTHRAAWILTHGEIPEATPFVLHRCDNPPCCNPGHLFLGTQADNLADCRAKGRHATRKRNGAHTRPERHSSRLYPAARCGERNGHSKLTTASVRDIRSSTATARELARRYAVSPSLVNLVRRRRIWAHVS